MKNDFLTKIKKVLGWGATAIFVFWALCLLAVGNPISAVITLGLAFLLSPIRKEVFDKFNVGLQGKKLAFTIGFFFLSSCGSFLGLTEVKESSTESHVRMEAVEVETLTAEQEVISTIEAEITEEEKVDDASEEEESTKEFSEVHPESSTVTKIEKEENKNSISQTAKIKNSNEEETIDTPEPMQVHFMDVGQGDATLVTCGDEAMLIDAGDNSKGTAVQLYLKKQGIEELKYLVLTHPDADHIGGADVVVTKFDIDTVFMSDFTKENKTYNELISALEYKGLSWSTPNVGNTYKLGSAEFTIIAPNTSYSDPNNSSIGLLLVNGENSFLFTGDAEEEAEYDILSNGLDINCDVYKAGHHGSKTASTEALLEAASPEYVVVSCAEDNSYGHPHAEPMNHFRSMGMRLYRTDEQGSIIAISDGNEIIWNCAPSESWQAGENVQSDSSAKTVTAAQNSTASISSSTSTSVADSNVETKSEKVSQVKETNIASTPESQVTPEPQAITEPEPEPEPTPAPVADVLVWKTKSGKKYHSINNCGNTDSSKATQITKTQAEAAGLGPCSKCW